MTEPFAWTQSSPHAQHLSEHRLSELRDTLARHGTKALLIIRHDTIVTEWYAPDHGPHAKHYTASAAKGLVGGCALMFALADGRIALDNLAADYIPAWRGDPLKSKITIRQLATHSSGLADAEQDGLPHDQLPGWKGAFWRREPDPFTLSRDDAPVIFEPGSAYAYSNTGIAMLGYAVTAALKGSPHPDIRTLLRDRLMRPIGVPDDDWSVGYDKTYNVDRLPLVAGWGGGNYTARAMAAVGRLMLRRGDWNGQRIVDESAFNTVTDFAKTAVPDRSDGNPTPTPACGWWTNADGELPMLSRDVIIAAGAEHQILLVAPTLDLILVRQGGPLGEPYWAAVNRCIFEPLISAVLPPVPPSPVIHGIDWAPPESIVRDGYHCDTWPMTWADDDAIYTAFGDGWGFQPRYETKRSMGVGKVLGNPPDIQCENIHSPSGEDSGDGASGRKACGMLMVDGLLYMLVRNADRAGRETHLGWSSDHGRTWAWADWRFTRFGYCTFLNFGRNYAGARDHYVYVYSHDHPSAYIPADRMILMRVPRDRIAARDAYEFFAGLDADGSPQWHADVDRRAAVFEHRRRCLRSGISYNAPLGRYLWWHQIPNRRSHSDTRFAGGLAIYDAPEPWGPWTCAFHTELWDVGPGETAHFPSKWMSLDGAAAYLVFSGDDYLSIRRAMLTVHT